MKPNSNEKVDTISPELVERLKLVATASGNLRAKIRLASIVFRVAALKFDIAFYKNSKSNMAAKLMKQRRNHFGSRLVALESSLASFVDTYSEIQKFQTIEAPPGNYLARLLQFLFTKRSFEHYFAQTIADAREEYFEALASNNKWTARWRRIQIYPCVGMVVIAWAGTSVAKKFSDIWKLL